MLRQSQNKLQYCCNLIKEQKITKIKEVFFWKFVGAVCYYVKNLWVHAPAAPVLTQALLPIIQTIALMQDKVYIWKMMSNLDR